MTGWKPGRACRLGGSCKGTVVVTWATVMAYAIGICAKSEGRLGSDNNIFGRSSVEA